MKKNIKNLFKYIFVLVLSLCLFLVACDGNTTVEKTDLEKALEATSDECASFTLVTTITQGDFEVYKETATYTLENGKFAYTAQIKKLNDLDSEDEYNNEEKTGTVDAAYKLDLKEEILTDIKIESGALSAKLTSAGLESLVGSNASDGTIELKVNDGKIASLVLSYMLNGQKTKIEANFNY